MVLLAWALVFWLVGFLAGLFLLQAFCCLFFPFSGSFLYTPCVLLGTLFSFVQYTAFIDQYIYIYITYKIRKEMKTTTEF